MHFTNIFKNALTAILKNRKERKIHLISNRYLACPHIRGDNPLVLASGLSPVHVDNHVTLVQLCT